MNNKLTTLYGLTLLLFTFGCASVPPEPTWRMKGEITEDSRSALSDCKYHIELNKIPEEKQDKLVTECMEGKGYRWH